MSVLHQRDWFEFILDLGLLERHLVTSDPSPEPSGCSLIVQFLYHANMTEQVYKTDLPDPQAEIKSKRIKILRVLAIKTASILDWNLLKFEKEIPIAVMSDLLHIFLRLTMNDNNEPKYHSQLELDKLENQTLFALQLLHRWCIRSVIFSKFPKKPPTKPVSVNMPGSLNSLQHMKDANENILKVITQNVNESVDFLEKMFNSYSGSVYKPLSDCFVNLNSETGYYDLKWENSSKIESDEIKAYISYDLGMHFFQIDNYEKSFLYFCYIKEFFSNSKNILHSLSELTLYANELESYMLACKSMLNLKLDEKDSSVTTNDNYTKQIINRIIKIDNCLQSNPVEIYTLLKEDCKICQLSLNYRANLETFVKFQNFDPKIIDLVSCSNLIRTVLNECSFYLNYKLDTLESISEVVGDLIDDLSQQSRKNLLLFIDVNFRKFNRKNQVALKNIMVKYKINNLSDIEIKMDIDEQKFVESTPSSPPLSSINVNTFKENSLLAYAKLSIQTSDPMILKNCINKYNLNSKTGLRFFWPKWQSFANELNNVVSNSNYMTNSYKLNNVNDADYFYICYAKIQQLIGLNKFSSALKLYKSYENSYNQSQKVAKFIRNQYLYLLIRNFIYNFDYSNVRDDQLTYMCRLEIKKKSTIPINQDEIIKYCRSFFDNCKHDSDISTELMENVFAFLLTIGEFNVLLAQESNFQNIQKKNIMNLNSPVFSLFKLTRQISRICLDMNKLDKNALRKIARELWDNLIESFTDTNRSEQTQSQGAQARDLQLTYQSREAIRKMFLLIKNRHVRTLIISVLTTIFNVADTQANLEINNELRYLWPSSLANVTSLNLNSLTDLLNSLLIDSLNYLNPFESNWLKTYSDILNTKNLINDSIRGYLQVLCCETKYFFKQAQRKGSGFKKTEEEFDDKIIRSLIKSCLSLNKHTQAALLCQCLSNNNNYGSAFKYLQDGAWCTLTSDEMDMMYPCIWDMALLEYLTNLNYQRGFINKKNVCIQLIGKENINPANPNEIIKKTTEAKKSLLFLKLLNYYFNN
ncbi:unnamed protein product [Brachionus calyciflorus]|uniref:INTS8 TPR repeats domain-containing protein n=1 Tax=Brachionus calyciflorus TaxID=104777 RepID=A0A813Z857_9BILA|nr:unnamed protein product [Brachionus calyciflorus]